MGRTEKRRRRHASARGRWLWLLALPLSVTPLRAEPYLALFTGSPCASCHVNRTGGGMRSVFGANWGRTLLPWWRLEPEALATGELTSRIRLGADLRGAYTGQLPEDGPFLGSYGVRRATLYLAVELVKERLSLYADQQVAPGSAVTREAFALVRARPHGFYVKAGRFFPPYGWRLQDDDVPIRRFTGFNFDLPDAGVEVGAEAGRWSLAAAVTNGSAGEPDVDNGKQLSLLAVHVRDRWRLGASASLNDLPGRQRRAAAGLVGGVRLGPLVALGEWDRLRLDALNGERTDSDSWHAGLDWIVRRGLDLRGWWGRHRADRDLPAATTRRQWGLGADWTPIPGLQVRLWYRDRRGPSDDPAALEDEVAVELHLFL